MANLEYPIRESGRKRPGLASTQQWRKELVKYDMGIRAASTA